MRYVILLIAATAMLAACGKNADESKQAAVTPTAAPVARPEPFTVTFPLELAQPVTALPCESVVLQPDIDPSE